MTETAVPATTPPAEAQELSEKVDTLAADLASASSLADADWDRAAAAGGIPYPRGRAWQTRDLPPDAVFVDQAGRRYKRTSAGELRRLKGVPGEEV